tara:strand:- start:56 stop:268 length:213 start_codon:yes stop_codon:yes gene_type:complete
MGSSKRKPLPKPPKIEEAPPITMEADLTAQKKEMKSKARDRMSVASTLMTGYGKKKNIDTFLSRIAFPRF